MKVITSKFWILLISIENLITANSSQNAQKEENLIAHKFINLIYNLYLYFTNSVLISSEWGIKEGEKIG